MMPFQVMRLKKPSATTNLTLIEVANQTSSDPILTFSGTPADGEILAFVCTGRTSFTAPFAGSPVVSETTRPNCRCYIYLHTASGESGPSYAFGAANANTMVTGFRLSNGSFYSGDNNDQGTGVASFIAAGASAFLVPDNSIVIAGWQSDGNSGGLGASSVDNGYTLVDKFNFRCGSAYRKYTSGGTSENVVFSGSGTPAAGTIYAVIKP